MDSNFINIIVDNTNDLTPNNRNMLPVLERALDNIQTKMVQVNGEVLSKNIQETVKVLLKAMENIPESSEYLLSEFSVNLCATANGEIAILGTIKGGGQSATTLSMKFERK